MKNFRVVVYLRDGHIDNVRRVVYKFDVRDGVLYLSCVGNSDAHFPLTSVRYWEVEEMTQ